MNRQSLLHLQMGQEVIYLLLSFFFLLSFVLLLHFMPGNFHTSTPREPSPGPVDPHLPQMDVPRNLALSLPSPPTDEPRHDQPPIIVLPEASGYRFTLGSAEISQEFRAKLEQDITDRLVYLIQQYDADLIEVVGHTDEVPVSQRSNLDKQLIPFLNGHFDQTLTVADNVGLGMARAATVITVLRRDPRLTDVFLVPLSAGQAVMLENRLADGRATREDAERRRIEIRLRRSR